MSESRVPRSIIIVGGGVFGLSTALSLSSREAFDATSITLLEADAECPSPDSASYDNSRILRADYSNSAYAALANEAQVLWRDQSPTGWGGEGRYNESGFALISSNEIGQAYVRKCLANLQDLKEKGIQDVGRLELLETEQDVKRVTGGLLPGNWGYVNYGSGWARADEVLNFVMNKLAQTRVQVKTGAEVAQLIFAAESADAFAETTKNTVRGVQLTSGEKLFADLVVIAMGPWSVKLIDLRGRVESTGQPLMYLRLNEREQELARLRPVVMNMSTGIYAIPSSEHTVKIGRNSYGYKNPVSIRYDAPRMLEEDVLVSLPRVQIPAPSEAIEDCQAALQQNFIQPGRTFDSTRTSWYTDTQEGNFLITYHPDYNGSLFLATGGSGHAWKFFPVIGDNIVDGIRHTLDPELEELWKWPLEPRDRFAYELVPQGAGGRGGALGMNLDEELQRKRGV